MSFFDIFQIWKTFDVLILIIFIFCRRGNKRFDVHFRRTKPAYFLSKDGDDAACEEEKGGKKCLFPAGVGTFSL